MIHDQPRQNGFETVYQNSKDGLAIFKQGAFVDCNPSMLHLVGLTRKEELIGKTPFDFSPPTQPDGRDSEEKGLEYINQCLEEGSTRFEWVHQTVNAEPFWAEVLITKMVVEGEVVIHANWRDISEKKELEFKLAEQKESFETLFNDSVDGLCLLENEVYTDCNSAFLNLFGFSAKEQVIGLKPADISADIQADGQPLEVSVPQRLKEADENESVRFEWKHKRIDGSEFWAEILITSTVINGNKVFYISTRDISEKKELALELAQQKESFETLFNESVDGLCWLEGDRYIDCNKAYLALFGFTSKQQVVGLTPMDLSAEYQEDGVLSEPLVPKRLKETEDKESVRFEWKHKKIDGSEFWAEVILNRIMLNGKKVRYAITRDISEKKELQVQLEERNRTLNRTNRELEQMLVSLKEAQDKLIESEKMASLGSLVAGVAHEINTPVGVGLMGITQFKEDINAITKRYNNRELTPTDFEIFLNDANEICELVKTNLDRTAQLVKGFKQIAVDQTSEEDREVNLSHYISEVIASLNSVLKKSRASVTLTCPDNIVVVLNPGLLYQVLSNLIMNSINHGFKDIPAGQILIVIEDSGHTQFSLNYRDNGSGISAEHLPQIFNPFFTTNRANGGTGLGLNVTYNIITSALGGSIECRSNIGEGVEFLLTFEVKQRLTIATP